MTHGCAAFQNAHLTQSEKCYPSKASRAELEIGHKVAVIRVNGQPMRSLEYPSHIYQAATRWEAVPVAVLKDNGKS